MLKEKALNGSEAENREKIRREIQDEIRTLGQKVAFILHPDQVQLRPCATLVFGPPQSHGETKPDPDILERYEKAVTIAQTAPTYWAEGNGRYLRHYARYEIEHAAELFNLYQIAGALPESEVLIYDLPLPYARDLWLPLFWFHR